MNNKTMRKIEMAVSIIKRSNNKKARNMLINIYKLGYADGFADAIQTMDKAIKDTKGIGKTLESRIEQTLLEEYNNNPIIKIRKEEANG